MRLRYRRTALSDIARAFSYLGEQSLQARQNFEARLGLALELLVQFPLAGGATARPGIRRLVMTPYPYAIFYRVSADALIVMRLRHTARRPSPALGH